MSESWRNSSHQRGYPSCKEIYRLRHTISTPVAGLKSLRSIQYKDAQEPLLHNHPHLHLHLHPLPTHYTPHPNPPKCTSLPSFLSPSPLASPPPSAPASTSASVTSNLLAAAPTAGPSTTPTARPSTASRPTRTRAIAALLGARLRRLRSIATGIPSRD
jgi:hypothetical protein